MKKSIIALLLLLSCHLNAQIQLPSINLFGCDFVVLPEIEGVGLSDELYYYQGDLSEEVIYYPGDTIYTSTQLFVYDEVNGWEECLVLIIIENKPILNMPDTVWYCNIGSLPKPVGEFITINATYYESNEYQNSPLYPGATIEEEGWYFLRDGYENCYVYDSVFIAISAPVYIEPIKDTLVCLEYIIPDFSPITNGTLFSFEDDLGNFYNSGDKITETTYLTVTSANNACTSTRSFRIYIFDSSIFSDLHDTIYCNYQAVSNPLTWYSYLPGFQDSYIEVSNGDNSTTYIVDYDWTGNGNCTYQDSFTVIDGSFNPSFFYFPDTTYLCNVGEVNLTQHIIRYIINDNNLDLEFYLENGDQVSNIINTQDIVDGSLVMFIHTPTISECFDSTQIHKKVFILNENCHMKDLSDSLNCSIPSYFRLDNIRYIPYGTKIYDSEYNQVNHTNALEHGDNTFYYIIKYVDGTQDTATHSIFLYEQIEIYPSKIDHGTLCYQDCITIDFENIDFIDTTYLYAFWDIRLYSLADSQHIKPFIAINKFLSICFDETSKEDTLNNGYLHLENHEYYLVFNDIITQGNNCVINNEPDTVYFSTLYNTSRYINDILCPDEEFVFDQDTFNIDNPNGKIIIENVAANGCDSIIIVDLEYDISSFREVQETYCDTNQFLFIGCELFDYNNQNGTVKFENASSNGCDSIVNVNLTFTISGILRYTTTFCEGDTLFHINIPVYENSIFSDTLSSNSGCDSIIIENLILMIEKEEEDIAFDILFDCANNSYTIYFLDSYPILSYEDQFIIGDSIPNITSDEIIISYGSDLNCLTRKKIELSYPLQWNISTITYEGLPISEEVVLEFESELISSIISWSPSDILSCDDCNSPSLLYNQDTTVLLQLTDEFGCRKEEIISISFLNENGCYVPNVISRSAISEKNRSFHVTTTNPAKYDLTIFDRWGSKIFTTQNISSNDLHSGWTPSRSFEIGVYVYLIKFHDVDKKEMIGTVLLLD